jgi:hypothetical protein
MVHDLLKLPTDVEQRPAPATLGAHDLVEMKSPAQPILGIVVEGEPLVVGGVRYWRIAWTFGGEQRIAWSPEFEIVARDRSTASQR